MFSGLLSVLSKPWQVVTEHGDVVDDDDETSSIGSDWSFMQVDNGSNSPSRSPSLVGVEASTEHDPRHGRPSGLPNSLDSPVRQDPEDKAASRQARPNQPLVARSRVATAAILFSNDQSVLETEHPDPVASRQAAARWNGAAHVNGRRSQRNKLNVDTQRAKCLRRGPQISTGFQRKQVRLMSGGQLPQERKSAANRK